MQQPALPAISQEVQPPTRSGMLDVLRNRNFLFLWIAQALSQTAQQVMNYVLLQQAFALSRSSTAVSLIMICFTLPSILFSAVAGVYVDRKQKRTVLTVANGLRTIVMLFYVFFTGSNLGAIALVVTYVSTLVFSSVGQFFNPAESAEIPLLVKRNQLMHANSLFNFTFTASQFIGFLVLGPVLVKFVAANNEFGPIYIVIAALFVLCTLLTWLLPKNEKVRPSTEIDLNGDGVITLQERIASTAEDLREGWEYIRNDRAIFGAIIQWSVALGVLLMLGVVGPRFIESELNLDPHDLYIILLPGGLGLVTGVILVGKVATPQNRLRVINFAILAAGIALIVIASLGNVERFIARLLEPGATQQQINDSVTPWLVGSMMLVAFFLGGLNSFISVPAQTTLQDRSHDEIRARVFGAFYTIQNIIVLVPLILVGALADWAGVVATIGLIGLVVASVALWGIRQGLEMPPEPAYLVENQ
jgi:MFS family permease